MVLLMEIKSALSTCEFELQSLRHQYEALSPGKVCPLFCSFWCLKRFNILLQTLTIPLQLLSISDADNSKQQQQQSGPGEIIDVVGSPGTPTIT